MKNITALFSYVSKDSLDPSKSFCFSNHKKITLSNFNLSCVGRVFVCLYSKRSNNAN